MKRYPLILMSAILAVWWSVAQADEVEEIYRLADQHKTDQAMERLEIFLKQHPKDARARFLKGLLLTDQKRRDDAIMIFRGLAEDYPELPEPLNNMAVLYAEQGSYEDARNALLSAIKTHPSYATAHENLGDIYAKMASQAYSKALQLNQGNSAAQAKLALVKKLFLPPGMDEERGTVVAANTRPSKESSKKTESKPVKAETAPVEMAKVEPVKAEPVKPEPVKVEPVKPEPVKVEAVKPEPVKVVPPVEPPLPVAKVEPVKKEVPAKVEGESKAGHRPQEAAVASALHAWAAAWSSQDVTRYLGYYSMQFKPADGTSRKDWEKVRTQRLRAPRFIQVQLSDVKVDMQDGGTAKVSFKQVYKSSSISSTGKKNLLMKQEAGAWRILQELFDG